jgi:antitoxin MazE
MYIYLESFMQVSKWGNSLAVRFPAGLVQALDLKEGEEIDLHLVGSRAFEVSKKPAVAELLARLHQFRGRLPADFHFDRLEANERGTRCEQAFC